MSIKLLYLLYFSDNLALLNCTEREFGGRGRSRTHQACLKQTSPSLKSGHPTGDDTLPPKSLA